MKQKLEYNLIYAGLLKQDLIIALCLFVDAFLIRFAFLLAADNFYGQEPMLNIITGLHILTNPALSQNVFYQQLPLFLYSLAGAVKLGSEQIISARFLIVVTGSLSVISYYYLIKKIFNRKIGLLSGVLLYSYYQHIIMSVVTMPDIIALGFLFLCLGKVFERKYFSAAVFGLIACGYSYLAWLVIPVIAVSIFLEQPRNSQSKLLNEFLFLGISCLFPLWWNYVVDKQYGQGWLWYKNFHNPDSLYTFLFLAGKSLRQILASLFLQPETMLFCLSFIGMFFSLKKKKQLKYILSIVFLIFLLSLNIFRKEILILDQGLLFVSALLIPYLIQGVFSLLKICGLKHKKYGLLLIISICLLSLIVGFYKIPKVPFSVKEASCWLKENASADSLIYLRNQPEGYHSVITMESGLPQVNFHYLTADSPSLETQEKPEYLVLPFAEQVNADQNKWEQLAVLTGYLIYQRKD
ncbi:MAG: glycosyltransferase family 39 protein [Candidatus Omnitrophica bacterium]|nr:glycosyltransferase family 39 protein [Candidatus Omnitrophota bacterium]